MRRYPTLFLLLLSAALALPASGNGLPERPQAVIKQQLVPDEAVTVVVRDAASGESLIEMNPATPRTPASVLKIVPTFAALDILGPAYTWKTRAWADGPIVHGVLKGNLYLQGGGDPLMTIERWWRFVSDLRQTGLKAIDGDVVIDDTLFAPVDGQPGDFDGRPYRTYNVQPNALLVNLQSSEIIVRPSEDGQTIEVAVDPFPANLKVENRIRPVSARCSGRNRSFNVSHPPGDPLKLVVSGTVSVSCQPQTLRQVIMGPEDFAYGTFRQLWEQQGGVIKGGMRQSPTPKDARELLEQESLTLAEIIRVTNKFSSNAMARNLVLTLGAENGTVPATVASGEMVITDWLKARGLNSPELVIDNGSGLSRDARIAGGSLATVLQAAWKSRFAPEFLATLPLGGLDGTLRKRFGRLKDASRIRMKTGTLNGASSIAGYVTGESGRTYVVVIMVNNKSAQYGPGEAIQAAVIDWVLGQ
jgi:D-alanyl-D-alanine carboxypeptidase/D-alanyl-D-alanine-endopeptidase (penicillin-binding protein 4)